MRTRALLKALHSLLTAAEVLLLLLSGLYAGYSLWDNQQIYQAAIGARSALLTHKPEAAEETHQATFEELTAINPDVCAWLTMDNTMIDYPVLHGETNSSYISTNVYREFSLSGSIFLDASNSPAFDERFALIHGHHMERRAMFGDLDLYREEAFFRENRTGTLILPSATLRLTTIACAQVDARDSQIYWPPGWTEAFAENLDFVLSHALWQDEAAVTQLKKAMAQGDSPGLLALSTCAAEEYDRTVLLCRVERSDDP